VGGSGDFGRGLAERLRRVGEEVLLGSRTPHDDLISNEECAEEADLVFLSVPPGGVEDMCSSLAQNLEGKITVSVASPIVFIEGQPGAAVGELAQRAAAGARVVAGFHTVSAKALARADDPLDEDVLICGDDEEAKAVVAELAERIIEGRAVDAGRLEVARWLEPTTAVLLNVNRRYKANAGVRITGLP